VHVDRGSLSITTKPTGVLARFGGPVTSPLRFVSPGVYVVRASTRVDAVVVFLDETGRLLDGTGPRSSFVHTGHRSAPRLV
jgi:hypothetical protein